MATKYGTPVDYMPTRKLRNISADLKLSHNLLVSRDTMIAAIKAA